MCHRRLLTYCFLLIAGSARRTWRRRFNPALLVIDRYAASGTVYTAANTGRSLSWCQQADLGLPKPDCVVFLKVSKQQQELRGDWGKERFEHDEFQQRVNANYEKLRDDTWVIINADQDESAVHAEILQKTLSVIQEVQCRSIELLGD
ncbi:KTHY kinase, partial [Acromyrmex charruanus]